MTTVRFPGTFLEDPETLAAHGRDSRPLRLYREFADRGVQLRLGRWLCALCWTGTDRPSALFDYANGWLVGHKVLLPGGTVLERFIAEIRSRMESRLWRLLVRGVTVEQRQRPGTHAGLAAHRDRAGPGHQAARHPCATGPHRHAGGGAKPYRTGARLGRRRRRPTACFSWCREEEPGKLLLGKMQ